MGESDQLQFETQAGCLLVRVQGRGIVEQKAATLEAIATALKTRNLRTTLLDTREVPGPITFMDRFQLGVLAGRYLAGISIGVLVRPDQADPQRIGQLAAKNRGAFVEVFTDPATAETWRQKHASPA